MKMLRRLYRRLTWQRPLCGHDDRDHDLEELDPSPWRVIGHRYPVRCRDCGAEGTREFWIERT